MSDWDIFRNLKVDVSVEKYKRPILKNQVLNILFYCVNDE